MPHGGTGWDVWGDNLCGTNNGRWNLSSGNGIEKLRKRQNDDYKILKAEGDESGMNVALEVWKARRQGPCKPMAVEGDFHIRLI